MKSFRSTWLMSAFVIGIAAYTVWDYKESVGDAVFAENERLAFTLTPNEVSEFKIKRGDETIVISKSGEQWEISEPVKDLADTASVQGYTYTLLAQRVRTFRMDEDAKLAPDWASTGLEKPAVTIEVTGKGKTESLSLSSKNAFDGSFYIRQKDELLLGDAGFAQLRDRTADSFRSRRLWRESSKPENAELNVGGAKFSLLKKDGKWTLEPKPVFEIDSDKIEQWMERIAEFSPSYIEKDGISDSDKRSFLLLKPSFTALINKDWLLIAGQDRAEDVFLYTNKRDTLYKNSQSGLSEIRVTPEFFRDGRKGFAFPLEQVSQIEVTTQDKKRVLAKNGSDWSLKGEDAKDFDLDLNKLATFLQNLRSLNGKAFFAKGEGFPAGPQIVLKNSEGQELFRLTWGGVFKGKNDVYVKTNLEKDIMSISKEKIDELIPHEMVRKKK